jgi:hypothetical protein
MPGSWPVVIACGGEVASTEVASESGLVGIDLLFRSGDPIEQQFADLPGVRTVLLDH